METKAFFKHAPERARQRLQHASVLRNSEGRPSSGTGREAGQSNDDGKTATHAVVLGAPVVPVADAVAVEVADLLRRNIPTTNKLL